MAPVVDDRTYEVDLIDWTGRRKVVAIVVLDLDHGYSYHDGGAHRFRALRHDDVLVELLQARERGEPSRGRDVDQYATAPVGPCAVEWSGVVTGKVR